LFSISQTSRGFYCLQWSSTENGPKVVSSNHIKMKNNFSDLSLLKDIVSNYKISTKNESNSLSVIINSNNVLISSIETLSNQENNKMISWYESNIMGNEFCDKYYNYYYPMHSNKNNKFLIVSFPKNIKNNLMQSSSDLGFNLIYLSIDVFSAAILVQHLHKKTLKNKYLLWKICKNNTHTLVLYKQELICSYVKIKKQANKYVKSFGIGGDNEINKLVDCVNNILIHKKSYEDIRNIYIYQTKENTSIINNILSLKNNNIEVLSLNKLVVNGANNKLKYMNYVENGICFKGLDL